MRTQRQPQQGANWSSKTYAGAATREWPVGLTEEQGRFRPALRSGSPVPSSAAIQRRAGHKGSRVIHAVVNQHEIASSQQRLAPDQLNALATSYSSDRLRHLFIEAFDLTRIAAVAEMRKAKRLTEAYSRVTSIARDTALWSADGEMAATTGVAVATACELLHMVMCRVTADVDTAPWTSSPLPDGGLQVEWRATRTDLEVEIAAGGELSYLRIERTEGGTTYEFVDDVSFNGLVSAVAAVLAS